MGGLLIPAEHVKMLENCLVSLRERHGIEVPFHSSKMRSRKDGWGWLGIDMERATLLYHDLNKLIECMPGHATGCIVHRPGYVARYSYYPKAERWRLCKSAYAILVERAAKLAMAQGRKLAVYVEQTGVKEDKAIREYHRSLRQDGMIFNPVTSLEYKPFEANGFRLSLLENPYFFDKNNVIGQLADLLLYPLIKGKYDPSYKPYQLLRESGRIIDQSLSEEDLNLGVKYYCFDP